MIRHIVMWKFKNFAEDKTKEENISWVKSHLEALPQELPIIRRLEVQLNENKGPKNYDAVLITEFDNYDDLETYRTFPPHVAVSSFVAKVSEERACVDYTL